MEIFIILDVMIAIVLTVLAHKKHWYVFYFLAIVQLMAIGLALIITAHGYAIIAIIFHPFLYLCDIMWYRWMREEDQLSGETLHNQDFTKHILVEPYVVQVPPDPIREPPAS